MSALLEMAAVTAKQDAIDGGGLDQVRHRPHIHHGVSLTIRELRKV